MIALAIKQAGGDDGEKLHAACYRASARLLNINLVVTPRKGRRLYPVRNLFFGRVFVKAKL
jgi:hypothetical protein